MKEFIERSSPEQMTERLKGRVVLEIKCIDGRGSDDLLAIHFDDGTVLRIEYSYLHAWEVVKDE